MQNTESKVKGEGIALRNQPKLTKLEQFVANNPNMSFATMAGQLNRTIGAMERAYDRLEKKLKASREQQPKITVAEHERKAARITVPTEVNAQNLKWAMDSRARWQAATELLEAKLNLANAALEDIANAGLGFSYEGFTGQQALQKRAMVGLRAIELASKEAK